MSESKEQAFAHCATISSIDLIKNRFECFPENLENENGSLDISIDSSHDHHSHEENHSYTVQFDLEVNGFNSRKDKIFELKSKFFLIYDLNKCASNWEEKEREYFKNRNAVLHAWPYIREHVDRLTAASPIPRAILPLYPLDK